MSHPTRKISIVTPSLNQGAFIRETIESVLAQKDPCFEHIVVDGGSSDGTLEILRQYPHLTWISEPDGGQADAVNKGFRMATGEIFGEINADDYYYPGTFAAVRAAFEAGAQAVTGQQDTVQDGQLLWSCLPRNPYTFEDALRYPERPIGHPSTFYSRRLWEQTGGLDPTVRYAPDVEFWLRLTKHCDIAVMDMPFAVNRLHAGSIQCNETDRNSLATLYHLAQHAEMDSFLEMAGYTVQHLIQEPEVSLVEDFHIAYLMSRWRELGQEKEGESAVLLGAGTWTRWFLPQAADVKGGPSLAAVLDDAFGEGEAIAGVPVVPFAELGSLSPGYAIIGSDTVGAALQQRLRDQETGGQLSVVDLYSRIRSDGPYPKPGSPPSRGFAG